MRKRYWIPGAVLVAAIVIGVHIMPHGYPPWSGVKKQTVFAVPIDLAELAARLGSPVTFDRRGDVVLLESFEDGLSKWIASGAGTGYQVKLSTKAARTGAYSARLVTGKTSAMTAGLTKYHPRPVVSQIGLEFSFAAIDEYPTVESHLYHYTGTGYYLFQVRYSYPTQALQYFDSSGDWQNLGTGLAFFPNVTSFNMLKLVVDLRVNEYSRVTFNDKGYTLPGEGGYWVPGVSAPYLILDVAAVGDAVDNYTVYVDDVILTQNEP